MSKTNLQTDGWTLSHHKGGRNKTQRETQTLYGGGGDLVHLGNTAEQNRHTQDKWLSKEEVSNTQIYELDIDRKVNKHRDMTD